ncbi:hypothetical protein ACFLR2_02350 [Chlamydiota bacterium]
MYRKAVWFSFICVLLALAIWFIVTAGLEVYRYTQLKVQTEVQVDQWSVQEIKSDQFAVVAHYLYTYQEKNYVGQGRVGGIYPNPWAAQEAKSRFSKQKWSVWLNPARPEKSFIEKQFPIKKSLSAAVLIGLVIYFFILSAYVRVKHG